MTACSAGSAARASEGPGGGGAQTGADRAFDHQKERSIPGASFFDRKKIAIVAARTVYRREQPGYEVVLRPKACAAQSVGGIQDKRR